jgi:hypothetical protein
MDSGGATVGAVGGYSGGASFQLEKFALAQRGRPIIEADVDLSSVLTEEQVTDAETCLDKALEFHIEDDWLDNETLRLSSNCREILQKEGDLIFGQSHRIARNLLPIFDQIGLTAKPSGNAIED